jgi:hypothetical protein
MEGVEHGTPRCFYTREKSRQWNGFRVLGFSSTIVVQPGIVPASGLYNQRAHRLNGVTGEEMELIWGFKAQHGSGFSFTPNVCSHSQSLTERPFPAMEVGLTHHVDSALRRPRPGIVLFFNEN